MQSHQQLNRLTTSFLQQLDAEEQLLHEALAIAQDLYAALRQGDLAPIKSKRPEQEKLAAALRVASDHREAAAVRLGQALGLKPEQLTLSALAKKLGDPHTTRISAARDRLSTITSQLAEFQQRNANLIHYLRSYFRGVLSALTKTSDVPVRYGSSGTCLTPAFGSAIKARG
jgi:hypothetical protein